MNKPNRFWSGALFVIGVDMGVQDLYGLEGYIAHLRADWITLSPFWGFAIAFVALVFYGVTELLERLDA